MEGFVYSFPSVVIIVINQAAVIPSWAVIFVNFLVRGRVAPREERCTWRTQREHAPASCEKSLGHYMPFSKRNVRRRLQTCLFPKTHPADLPKILFNLGSQRPIPQVFTPGLPHSWVSLVPQMLKNPPAMQETRVQSLSGEDPLEKGMATHSSILAWEIVAWWATVQAVAESDTTEQLKTHCTLPKSLIPPENFLFTVNSMTLLPWLYWAHTCSPPFSVGRRESWVLGKSANLELPWDGGPQKLGCVLYNFVCLLCFCIIF